MMESGWRVSIMSSLLRPFIRKLMSDDAYDVVFSEGYRAWWSGLSVEECPYPKYSFYQEVWCDGWNQAVWERSS